MTEPVGDDRAAPLQFDTVSPVSPGAASTELTCRNCHERIDTEYYQVNGHDVCSRCQKTIEKVTEPPGGAMPLLVAGVFGLGAGLVGAAIYYAVIALAHLEIGIVAILIGYMVGYAVRRGAGNRGGRRFQVLAIALTYLSVAFAYTPLAIGAARREPRTGAAAAPAGQAAQPAPAPDTTPAPPPRARSIWVWLPVAFGLIAALPVLVIVGTLPSGLITAIIIFVGMRQAWRMTGAPRLEVLGPFRIGPDSKPLPA